MIVRNTVSFITNNTLGEKPDHSPALGKRFKFITFAMFGFRVILPVIAQQHSLLGGEANSNQPGEYDEYFPVFCSVPEPQWVLMSAYWIIWFYRLLGLGNHNNLPAFNPEIYACIAQIIKDRKSVV